MHYLIRSTDELSPVIQIREMHQWYTLLPGVEYKKICWRLDERGGVGEAALHACFLNASCLHEELARRLLRVCPALINDIYISDDFYGETLWRHGMEKLSPP